jgi:hypothetical protein
MSFRGVFLAVFLGTALIVAAFIVNAQRPRAEIRHPTAALVRATGKCAECHRKETSSVIHEYEMSRHAAVGVNCLQCHAPLEGQATLEHKGFAIATKLTANNCKQCHPKEYEQYLESRHAAAAWAAVKGKEDFTAEQVSFAEARDKGSVDRPPNELAMVEGPRAVAGGCIKCHSIGRPNEDGSIGNCTACHARHASSVELARLPETCGQCHMGPDHAQLEIYHESKHGVLFHAQRNRMDLTVDPDKLTTADMPVPTCSTCHMSGLEGEQMTHNVSDRLTYYLFAAVSKARPQATAKRREMQTTCLKCHTQPRITQFYREAEGVLRSTNKLVEEAGTIVKDLREADLLTPEPFDEPIEYLYFDLWHYGGRTAKHGAFMGGADFVQWHGYYEVVAKLTELRKQAEELKSGRAVAEGATDAADRPASD